MSEYKFTSAERYAVFVTHGERCYLCSEPVDLKSMEVDHILPEKLLSRRGALRSILRDYGISAKFGINSYENWLPACGRCNLIKRAEEFSPSPMLQVLLQRAARRASLARSRAAAVVKSREVAKALNVLERVGELGGPAVEVLEGFVRSHRSTEDVSRPVLLTPTAPLQIRLSPEYLRKVLSNYPGEIGFAARLDNLGRLTVCAIEGVDVERISISSARWNPELLEFEEAEPLHADPVVSSRVYQLMARGMVESEASLDAKCVEIFGLLRAHGLPSVRHGNLPAYLSRFAGKVRHLLENGMRAVFFL